MLSVSQYLKKEATAIFNRNWVKLKHSSFHQPALGNYQSFFAWDSGWHIIALSLIDTKKGIEELETIFTFQREDGSIPHEVRLKELGEGEDFTRWCCSRLVKRQYDDIGRSYFIDPPSYLIAAEILYNRTKDKRILNLLPLMEKCLDYYINNRDLMRNGLICIVHPWECGTDNAPYFDKVFGINQRYPWWKIKYGYDYIRNINRLSQIKWGMQETINKKMFVFQDVGLNGIVAAGAVALSKLYRWNQEEKKAVMYEKKAENIIRACEKYFWDEKRGFFYPRWCNEHYPMIYRTCLNGLAPLLTGMVEKEKADRMINHYLDSTKHFATDWGVSFNSISELGDKGKTNKDKVLWHGSCQWINMSWIAAKAADTYGYPDVARKITTRVANLIYQNGFREYYNPVTGEGMGAHKFTWPALVLDMIAQYQEQRVSDILEKQMEL